MTTDDNSFNSQQFKPVTIRYNKSSAFSASKRLFSIRPLQTDEFLDEKKKTVVLRNNLTARNTKDRRVRRCFCRHIVRFNPSDFVFLSNLLNHHAYNIPNIR